jgi:hypothetical protein
MDDPTGVRRRRIAFTAAAVVLLALLFPLTQANLDRLGEPIEVVDRPAGPEAAPASTTTATTRRAARPAPRHTAYEVRRALTRLPPGWSDLPPPPVPRARAVSLWTGRHLFFWGGDSGNGGVHHADGWLLDPVAWRWRATSRSPLAGRSLAAAVWTGDEVIVWGGYAKGGTFNDGAAYDPATDAWRQLPRVKLSPQASTAAWTGSRVLAWDYDLRAASYDPKRNPWRRLPGPPLESCEASPDGAATNRMVLAQGCGHALWDVRAGRWIKVERKENRYYGHGRVVAAGPVFLIAGADHESNANGLVAYNPQ